MELRQYWDVIWRRRWLVLVIVLAATAVSVVMFVRTPWTYETQVKFITRQAPDAPTLQSTLFINQPYASWIGSEFLVDEYTEIVKSDAFAIAVNEEIGGGLNVPFIKASIDADRKNRELRLIVTGRSPQEAAQLADAAGKVLTQVRIKPIQGIFADDKPVFTQIDLASPDRTISSRNRELINAAVRIAIGVVAALALTFLLEYLDNSVRDERDAERVLDLPVIGAIPRT
jgi:capsular polysaccharide biosynthesis protein